MKKRLMAAVLALVLTAALSASALAGETAVGTLDQAPRPMQQENPWLEQCELGCVAAVSYTHLMCIRDRGPAAEQFGFAAGPFFAPLT